MKKILVIEDEAKSRDIFLDSLEAAGFEVLGAENGLVGVKKAQENLPDLVICDVVMSDLDGYSVLTTLRQKKATVTIPFIFITAKVSRSDIRKAMELGADDYLIKPCTVEELLRAIAACLEKRAILQKQYAVQYQPVPETVSANIVKSADLKSILPDESRLREVFHFIEVNFHRPITLSDVAQAVGYSPAYLTNLVRQKTGHSLYRWITHRRMAQAYFLLLETNQTVTQIAANLGYQNLASFCRQFRQINGKSPQNWRTEYQHFFNSTQTSAKELITQSKEWFLKFDFQSL